MKTSVTAKVILSFGLTACAPLIGALFTTRSSITGWYANLNKPFFTPPGWLFGPAWTILYILMAAAAFLVWRKGAHVRLVRIALLLYFIQLTLNAFWTPLFFGLQMPLLAFVEIILLWLAVVLTLLAFARVSPLPALLLVPYLLWTTFAAVLNASICLLNQ
jgi:benzodiazapine receptor